MVDIEFPPPNLIGMPERYDRWRQGQVEAVQSIMDSPKRFVVIGAPTGFGKSLVYVAASTLTERRTVGLTSTKALQEQLHSDYPDNIVQIKGLNSYECIEGRPSGKFGDMQRHGYRADRGLPMACDEAPCQSGAYCARRDGGCLYYDAYRTACHPASRFVITNYAYYMSVHKYSEGLGPIDMLVMDEAHNAVDELGGFVGTELRPSEIEAMFPGKAKSLLPGADQSDWREWGSYWLNQCELEHEHLKMIIKQAEREGQNKTGQRVTYAMLRRAAELRRMTHKLSTIATMSGDWVIDWVKDSRGADVVKFDPIWPGEYAEQFLFLDIPKVVMVSATVRPKTAEMLGIKASDVDFREYPSSFPKQNRPIVYVPTAHMNQRSQGEGLADVCARIDQIAARRPNYKGLIQTVSYPRARDIYRGCKSNGRMLMHDPTDTRDKVAEFKRSREPLILVSPVMDTGYDFPHDMARWQVLVKVPFPVTIDKIVKARCERDREYRDYVTMVKIVQMAGRIVRADDDMGETFILDSDFGWWFWGRGGNGAGIRLAPRWFTEAIITRQFLEPALPVPARVK